MKQIKYLFAISFVAIIFSSCSITRPAAVTENEVGDKNGSSSNTCILSGGFATFFSDGSPNPKGNQFMGSAGVCFNNDDYSIQSAAEQAGIDEVASVDLETTWYFFWTQYEIQVNGK